MSAISTTKKVIVGGVAATAAAIAVGPGPAIADHPSAGPFNSSGNDCTGYYSKHNQSFYIRDNAGGDDNDHCYVDYGGSAAQAGGSNPKRVAINTDSSIGNYQRRAADLSGIENGSLYFQVCEERENDDDLCSSVHGGYATK